MFGIAEIPQTVPMMIIVSVAIVSIIAWIIKPLKYALILNPYLVVERFQVHRLLTAGWLHADASPAVYLQISMQAFTVGIRRIFVRSRSAYGPSNLTSL